MICRRQRLIFVHLRRTAGNSIEAALGGIVLYDRWFRRTLAWDSRLHRGPSLYKRDRRGHRIHATAEEIRARHPREFDRCFRFSIVRDPWEQMASLYARLHEHDRRYVGFGGWLARFRLVAGTVPQASLFDAGGECLVHFIGRFERLQDDFDSACDQAGISRRALPRTNGSAMPALESVYDDDTIAAVGRLYRRDVERFGYTFAAAVARQAEAARRRVATTAREAA